MLQLFYVKNDETYKRATPPKLDYVFSNMNGYVDTVKNYYSNASIYLPRPNMLINLLGMLEIDVTLPVEEVYNQLDITAIYTANQLGIVTTMNDNSTPREGVVVPDATEYFLRVRESFDYFNKDYIRLMPIKAIYSTIDTIFMYHPRKYPLAIPEIDINIYTIDPVMLGIQYYHWTKEAIFNKEDIDPARFLYEITLTNVIDSMFNVCLLNRYKRLLQGEKPSKFINFNPFMVKDFTKDVDKIYKWVIKYLGKKRDLKFAEVCYNIPVRGGNALDTLKLPDLRLNKRNSWLLWLSRLDVVNCLLAEYASKQERDTVNDIDTTLYRRNRGGYFSVNDPYTKSLLTGKLDTLRTLLKEAL